MKGILTLIPTPIDENSPLEQVAFDLLERMALNAPDNSIFVIEDLKPGRKRWLRFGLPRETVDEFVLLNEHTKTEVSIDLINQLKRGKNVYLMSDGGLPAFCDPGLELVRMCHEHWIKVTSTPFPNSIALALALSGIDHNKFSFEGFLPRKSEEREKELRTILKSSRTVIVMDTPYRLKAMLDSISQIGNPTIFLALDLGDEKEELLFGQVKDVVRKVVDFKREFVLIIEPRKSK